MIEQLSGFPDNVLAFTTRGRITGKDYETVLIPAIEVALKAHKKLRLLYKIDGEFAGFDPGAVWDDFKVGMEHFTRWERIGVITDVAWISHTIDAIRFLMPATVRVFATTEEAEARKWIVAA